MAETITQAKMMESTDILSRFDKYFNLEKNRRKLEALAGKFPQQKSFDLDLQELSRFDHDLADAALDQPDLYRYNAELAVKKMTLPAAQDTIFSPHVRFYNIPDIRKFRPMVLELGSEHLDKLICIDGTISSIGDIKPHMKKAVWKCRNCDTQTVVLTEKTAPLSSPFYCENCKKNVFDLDETLSTFADKQRADIQDAVEKLSGNVPAVHVELWLEDDLTNKIAPGDKVVLTGVLRLKPLTQGKQKSSVYAKFFEVMHVHEVELEFEQLEITKEEEEQIIKLSRDPKLYEKMIQSVAPGLFGYSELKQSIALQLFSGTPGKSLPDGEKIRSDIHILMIGDPGTGKSTMLEYVNNIAPKSIVVSGGSSSGVGLTAAAEKEDGGEGWILKAGAMVLANGGVVAIDELDKMNENDRGAMHQAMEQQRISIAKAGIVTEFQTRTSVLAAANPKLGRFDPNTPPAGQFNLSPALLSRFDLIFTMRDVLDESRDRGMAKHILEGHQLAASKKPPAEKKAAQVPVIDQTLLRKYIAYARMNVAPEITKEAADKISDYYVEMRKLGKEQNTFPITARQIEGLVRLAEASAKMRLSPLVELQDAQRAVDLEDFVIREIFVDKETGKLDSDVISLGQSKSRLDRVRTVLNIIRDLEREYDVVAVDEIVKEARNYQIDEFYARNLVEELQRKGELYGPKPGFVKSARTRE